jgi:hypothetical protein
MSWHQYYSQEIICEFCGRKDQYGPFLVSRTKSDVRKMAKFEGWHVVRGPWKPQFDIKKSADICPGCFLTDQQKKYRAVKNG